jgi:hypothetical protein
MGSTAGVGTLQGGATLFVPKFRVVAPLALVRSSDGQLHHCYQGCLIDWLNEVQEKQFLEEGIVELVEPPAAAIEPEKPVRACAK